MAEDRKTRILVVEDERVIASLLQDVLEDSGFEVVVVGAGQEALGAHAAAPFDLAIIDYGLPDQNGLEVARQLGPGPSGRRPRIILATGWGLLEERQLAGIVDELIQKPFNMARLVTEVERQAAIARG